MGIIKDSARTVEYRMHSSKVNVRTVDSGFLNETWIEKTKRHTACISGIIYKRMLSSVQSMEWSNSFQNKTSIA
jgi:hypothetical protein